MMPHACKVPLGRKETELKSRKTELKLFKTRARQNFGEGLQVIARQPIGLESCLNHLRIQQVF